MLFSTYGKERCGVATRRTRRLATHGQMSSEDEASCNSRVITPSKYHYHLTMLIPAYNERHRIGETLSTYVNYLTKTPVYRHRPRLERGCANPRPGSITTGNARILVVDDGSTDGTADFICGRSWRSSSSEKERANDNFWAVHEDVTVISLPKNCGKGAAIERGMAELHSSIMPGPSDENANSDGPVVRSIVLVADADGSGDISCIDDMLRCMEEMLSISETSMPTTIATDRYPFHQLPAVIVGCRQYLEPKSRLRSLLSWGFRTCVSIIFIGADLGIRDTQCGFKLMTASAGKVLYNKLNLRRWTQDVEVIHRARVIGIPVGQCNVPWIDKDGSKLVTNKSDAVFVSLAMLGEIACMRLLYALGIWEVSIDS
jgi:dolichyl-phosphate beta-glucosyltransferase